MAIKHITKKEFLENIWNFEESPKEWKFRGERPAIVDFYAVWCGPCQMLSPELEEIAEEYKGKVDIYKVNTDEEDELCAAFGIRSIPALLFCPVNGEPSMTAGFQPKAALRAAIGKML